MEFEPLGIGTDVIEFDMMGLGEDAVEIEQPLDDDDKHFIDTPYDGGSGVYVLEGDTNLEPYEGMEFDSEEAAKAFYNSYARRVGFSTRVSMSRRSRRDGAIIQRSFVCAKEGFRVEKEMPGRRDGARVKRPRAETRVGCKAMLVVKVQDSGKWVVSGFVKEHNHELVPPDKVHCLRSHRHVSGAAKSLIDTLQGAGIGPSGIMSALIKEYGGISNVGYGIREHEWLQTVYADRQQWVPVYLRDSFFAEISITQSSDSMNSYFDGYVNASTTLQLFVKQYEKALESRYEKEVKADYDTMNTAAILKTPSPMEKQAAEVYTRKLFIKFQEELVETLAFLATKVEDEETVTTYRVAKYGESHKAYFVRFSFKEMKAACSCQMFEFSGLVCRHILTVFRVTNVLTLPSHYVLKRWTRNAKSGVMLEERTPDVLNSSRESLTVRYNNLRHKALKYVDEGVKTVEVYNIAVDALQEAANKVAVAKRNGGRLTNVIGNSRGDSAAHRISDGPACGDNQWGLGQPQFEDDQDRMIQKLSRQLERAQRKCDAYRANLLSVLKDIEQQKLELTVKVQNIKLSMKD
ncbi:hypothetical protein RJ640_003051 [Escallonia rubra]|uniref:Protein FAR1-RELATED SEQUENCE n=1 Tax=Escallonia rubra TaxID=112253 RepID=A0AA88R0G3_9ASTE|nr:hypothetical protein RJ640_003051 [Escallonia rubra]